MKRFEKFCIAMCLFVSGFCAFQCIPEASAQVISSYVRRAGDTMNGLLTFSQPSNKNVIQLKDFQRLKFDSSNDQNFCYGQTGIGLICPTVLSTVNLASSAASGNNALGALTNGARIDLGSGSNDYFKSDGTSIITPGPFTAAAVLLTTGATLPVCVAALEGTEYTQGGQAASTIRTKICMCTSDGAASPAYAWENIINVTVGTASVCP